MLGAFGPGTFTGYVNSNADGTKSEIETAMSRVLPESNLVALTLPDTFFQRNGIADDRREAVAKRLLSVLVSWKTVDEGELACGKEVLRVGFDMPEKFTLNYNFQLMLDSGSLVDHGREWHTKRGNPPEA